MKEESTHINIRGTDGRVFASIPILRLITLRGIPGFCIYRYITDDGIDEYRVGHIETGSYLALTRAATDGEAFVAARKYNKEELEHKIIRTRRELDRLQEEQQKQEKK